MIESLLLAATQISTFEGQRPLTKASGFFFERDGRLFLVTSRHVFFDAPSKHTPDRIEFEIHVDATDWTQVVAFSILLYRDGKGIWRQGKDTGGEIDVAVVEIDREMLPASSVIRAFAPEHLQESLGAIEIGTPLLIVGFPLGFHDTLNHLPVVRHAVIASSFGLRFQGQGLFLTDARMHRGTSGAAVVMRSADPSVAGADMPWKLLGVHSASLDMQTRDQALDESLGLNCAWYASIVMTLSEPDGAATAPGAAATS